MFNLVGNFLLPFNPCTGGWQGVELLGWPQSLVT